MKFMKTRNINLVDKKLMSFLLISAFSILFFTQCEIQEDFEYDHITTQGKLDINAWEFIQQTDSLSLLEEAIKAAGLQNFYSGSTDYTFIMPKNKGFRSYLATNGYSDISDIPEENLKDVLEYHIVEAHVNFSDPELIESNDPVAYETIGGEIMYLSRNNIYQGVINQDTQMSWTIVTSNIEVTNGVIHVTNDVVYLLE